MDAIKYKILYNFDLLLNLKMLNLVYFHIVGRDAINLYIKMLNIAEMNQSLGFDIDNNHESLILETQLSTQNFNNNIKLLEGIGLIKKYIDTKKNDFIIYKIEQALSWDEFKNNIKYINLLKLKTDEMVYEKIKYSFDQNDLTIGLTNISDTFENVFKDFETEKSLDFEFVYDLLYKKTKTLITLDPEAKNILNNAYKKYDFNTNQLIECIKGSIIRKTNLISIDNKLLLLEIKKIIDSNNILSFNNNIKINRNKKVFIQNINIDDYKDIIDDYKTLNSEQYLSCLQQHSLSEFELKCIKDLRKEYKLPDFIINILIDYCVFINNGRLEPAYLSRIALSINRLNLKSIPDILKHLHLAWKKRNKINSFNDNNKFEEVDW